MPPSARLEQPALLHARVGERAALVAEQLALEQLLGQRRAGDVHERPRRAVAGVVNHLRDEVLAGAALAGEQHRRRRAGRDLGDQVPQTRSSPARRRRSAAGCTAAPRSLRNCRTSRRSRVVSSARATVAATSSRLNGLLAKWYAPSFIASTAVSTLAYAVSRMTRMSWIELLDLAQDRDARRYRAADSRAAPGRRPPRSCSRAARPVSASSTS